MLKKEKITSFKNNVDVVEIENEMEVQLLKEEIEQRRLRSQVVDGIDQYVN